MIDGPRIGPAAGPATSLVILLHGYGSNGDDLIGLAPHWRAALPHAAFVAPNAPEICPGAPDGYQWWGIASLDRSARAAGAARAAPALEAFIDAELARLDLTEASLALVGFSQGTMMALHVGPRRSKALAGIVGYSGMLADPEALAAEVSTKPPALLIHGQADPTLPVAAMYQAATALEALDFEVATHVSPGLGHSIDAAGLQLGGQFLSKILS
jgi:phospholipase/carboxylesterase